jgi:hypothetical protein
VDCRHDSRGEGRRENLTALLCHAEASAKQRLRGCRSEANDEARLHQPDFCFEPGQASRDLGCIRLGMDATLTASLPLEVLNNVRDKGVSPLDARIRQCFVEQSPGGSDERLPLQVLLMAGLLTHQ